jgi:hypothetical protein
MKNQLLSLLISLLVIVCHKHFRPIGSSLFVFAWFIVFHSLLAFLLSVVLYFAVEAVFPAPVAIVAASGVALVAALPGSLVAVPALESVIPFVLEGCHFVLGVFLVFLVLGLAVILDRRNWFRGFQSGFPLSIGSHLVHVVQRHRGLIVLGHGLPQVSRQGGPEKLHLKELRMLLAVSLVHCLAVFSNSPTCPSP